MLQSPHWQHRMRCQHNARHVMNCDGSALRLALGLIGKLWPGMRNAFERLWSETLLRFDEIGPDRPERLCWSTWKFNYENAMVWDGNAEGNARGRWTDSNNVSNKWSDRTDTDGSKLRNISWFAVRNVCGSVRVCFPVCVCVCMCVFEGKGKGKMAIYGTPMEHFAIISRQLNIITILING